MQEEKVRFLSPSDAAEAVRRLLKRSLTKRVVADLRGSPFSEIVIALRPRSLASADVIRFGLKDWDAWTRTWRHYGAEGQAGIEISASPVNVQRVPREVPLMLTVRSWSAVRALITEFGHENLVIEVDRAKEISRRLEGAAVEVDEARLSTACKLTDVNVESLVRTLKWLFDHPDLGRWTARQLQIPGVNGKWPEKNERLIRSFIDRDLAAELKPRLAVVHFTYVDPDYRATGGRHHDAWTEHDAHTPAYSPKNVVIVENRDCRLHFLPMHDTIVVEGEGKAAGTLVKVDWIREADRIFYWGDLDSDGFAILNRLRAELESRGTELESVLMDSMAWASYLHLGVNHDKEGIPLKPCSTPLPHLNGGEADCYAILASQGEKRIRRIEQERIPLGDARTELRRKLAD